MYEIPENKTDHTPGTLWSWTWPLLFLCTMTVLSMTTQRYSGYVEPHATVAAHRAQPSPGDAR